MVIRGHCKHLPASDLKRTKSNDKIGHNLDKVGGWVEEF